MARTISVEPELFSLVPGYRRTVVLARRSSASSPAAIGSVLAEAQAACRERAGGAEVTALPSVERWRRAFRTVGLDPTRTRPAVEALARRVLKGEGVALGNELIDLGSAVSLAFLVPVGVHVLDDLEGDLELGRATGDEEFETFQGEREQPEPGEIVYRCGAHVLTRRWVWRQGRVGSVTPTSTLLAINVDSLDEEDRLDEAVRRLCELLESAGAEALRIVTLTGDQPVAALE